MRLFHRRGPTTVTARVVVLLIVCDFARATEERRRSQSSVSFGSRTGLDLDERRVEIVTGGRSEIERSRQRRSVDVGQADRDAIVDKVNELRRRVGAADMEYVVTIDL